VNSEKIPQPERTKSPSRVNVAIILLFVVAMTVVMALNKQQPCDCGAPGGSCPSPTRQVEQSPQSNDNPTLNPMNDGSHFQQPSETPTKE
jgi:hypothetical protein